MSCAARLREYFENGGADEAPPPPELTKSEAALCWGKLPDAVKWTANESVVIITLNRPDANNAMDDDLTRGLGMCVERVKQSPDVRVCFLTGAGKMFCAGGDPKQFQQAAAAAKEAEAKGVLGGDDDANAAGAMAFAHLLQARVGLATPPPATQCPSLKGYPRPTRLASQASHMAHSGPILLTFRDSAHRTSRPSAVTRLLHGRYTVVTQDLSTLGCYTVALANGTAMGGGFGLLCCCDCVIAKRSAMFALSEVCATSGGGGREARERRQGRGGARGARGDGRA